ncbi:MAG: hypothetical protein GVY24_04375 [Planctomycetes bacterium]|jgi:hypothetical protein|nr:hypothetical protein [Planctomycetota bacterium]
MTQAAFGGNPFSTRVKLWLEGDAGKLKLSHVGADFVIASEPCSLPAQTPVTVVVSVDGKEHRHRYLLREPLTTNKPRARTMICEPDGLPF